MEGKDKLTTFDSEHFLKTLTQNRVFIKCCRVTLIKQIKTLRKN